MNVRLAFGTALLLMGCPSSSGDVDAGGDGGGGGADPCAIHTSCESCAEETAGGANCDWCAGRCVSRPGGVDFDDDSWCEWGHAHIAGRCTEGGGVRIAPTSLPLDCRHSRNADEAACTADEASPGSVGAGPRFPGEIENGFLDASARTLYVAATTTVAGADQGVVYAVDLDTGDRTVVTGAYEDPRTGVMRVGSGPELVGYLFDVRRHPSGDLVVWGDAGFFRVDAAGARTLLHDGTSYCTSGDWEWNFPNRNVQHAMDVDASGRLIVPTLRARDGSGPPPMPDDDTFGIAALDGASCSYVTFATVDTRFALGSGPIPLGDFTHPLADGTSLLVGSAFGRLYRVDPATGARVTVSAVQDGVGSGGEYDARPGDWGFTRRGDAVYSVRGEALSAPTTWDLVLTEIDLATGDVTPHFNATELGGTNRLGLGRARWIAPHPDHEDWFVVSTARFIAIAELSSGNVNVLSY